MSIEFDSPHMIVLRKKATSERIGVSTSTLDRLRARGEFPAPIQLGAQAIGWALADLQAWLAARPRASH